MFQYEYQYVVYAAVISGVSLSIALLWDAWRTKCRKKELERIKKYNHRYNHIHSGEWNDSNPVV